MFFEMSVTAGRGWGVRSPKIDRQNMQRQHLSLTDKKRRGTVSCMCQRALNTMVSKYDSCDSDELSSVSSSDSYFSELYEESSGGGYESNNELNGGDCDLQEDSTEKDIDLDLQSHSKHRLAPSSSDDRIENRNHSSFHSSESNLSAVVASVWSAQGVESPISIFLKEARQTTMSSPGRNAPQRSHSFEDTTISMPKIINRWLEVSSRSDGSLEKSDTSQLCTTRLPKRHEVNNSCGGPRGGGNSFFLNMMTASTSNESKLILANIDLSKPIGLCGMRSCSHTNERLMNQNKKTDVGLIVPPSSPKLTNLSDSGFNIQCVTACNDPLHHFIPSQQNMVNDTIHNKIQVACPSLHHDASGEGDLDPAHKGTDNCKKSVASQPCITQWGSQASPLQMSCSSRASTSLRGSKKYDLDSQVNLKWRQCLSRSRSLRLVSLRN